MTFTTIRRVRPRARRGRAATGTLALAAVAFASSPLSAQAGRSQVREGNRLYEEGRYADAHERYIEALREDPESPLIRFNAGNALYRGQDFQRAMAQYRQAIEAADPGLAAAAWYNLGNALYRARQLAPSLEAYKQALRLDPGDDDAKYNFERVLQELQEQEQQQRRDQEPPDEGEDRQDQDTPSPSQPQPGEDPDQGPRGPEEDRDPPNPSEGPPEPRDTGGEAPPERPNQPPPEGPENDPSPAQPPPGTMSREQAERLLDAIEEDPEDVNRKPAVPRGRKPRKAW